MSPRVALVGEFSSRGGAGHAMSRIFDAIQVANPGNVPIRKFTRDHAKLKGLSFRNFPAIALAELLTLADSSPHSIATGSQLFRQLIDWGPDIINLHWLGKRSLSVSQIAALRMPIVWTLHDLWPVMGTRHLPVPEHPKNYHLGRDFAQTINDFYMQKKLASWTQSFWAVSPSKWLANEAQESEVSRHWKFSVIPNPIDNTVWKPNGDWRRRSLIVAKSGTFNLTFVANKALTDSNKGFLLIRRLAHMLQQHVLEGEELVIRVVGGSAPMESFGRVKIVFLGTISDATVLRNIYSASQLTLMPSMKDNFPNVALESMACGTPVLCFSDSGIDEMVTHEHDGLVARRERFTALPVLLLSYLRQPYKLAQMGDRARQKAVAQWSPTKIGSQYMHFYENVLREFHADLKSRKSSAE